MTALLAALAEESPAAPTNVDPDDFAVAAQKFSEEQAVLAGVTSQLWAQLSDNVPFTGKDQSGTSFAAGYEAAAKTVLDGLTALVSTIGSITQGLGKAGTDHNRADAISSSNWQTTNYQTITVSTVPADRMPGLPPITGYEPGWLPTILGGVWPCKDDDKLTATAHAWQTARDAVNGVRDSLHQALTGLTGNNTGDDVTALDEFWTEFVGDNESIFPALDNAMGAIAAGVSGYGQMIDNFNGELTDAVIEAVLESGLEAAGAIVLDIVTDGVASAFSGPEGAAIAAQAVSKIAGVVSDIVSAMRVDSAIQDIAVDSQPIANLHGAVQDLPQPQLTTTEAWQAGDDTQGVNDHRPRGSFNPDETKIAGYLRQQNRHVVMPIYEDHSQKDIRNTDALVDGYPVEFKTLNGSGKIALRKALHDSEKDGVGQSDTVVVDARTSSLSENDLQAQLRSYFSGRATPGTKGVIKYVTVLVNDNGTTKTITYPDGYGGL